MTGQTWEQRDKRNKWKAAKNILNGNSENNGGFCGVVLKRVDGDDWVTSRVVAN